MNLCAFICRGGVCASCVLARARALHDTTKGEAATLDDSDNGHDSEVSVDSDDKDDSDDDDDEDDHAR